jgi:di/tricarboxylate transporter
LTTQIGTPPNILVSEALRENGLVAFRLFDFTPVGLAVMVAGILFMAFFGIRLLPLTMPSMPVSRQEDQDLSTQYQIQERMFSLQIPRNSALIGRSIADSRLGSVLGLNVVGITRVSQTKLAPTAGEILQENDALLVEGVLGEIESLKTELTRWSE